jgi:hypothetical protein
MTTKQRLAALKRAIELQQRTLRLLEASEAIVDNGATVALTKQIIANLHAQIRLIGREVMGMGPVR